MADKKVQPIIKKVIKKGGHGHHGGAWKIAYADFVTAMMAFFLLMWLLNATTEAQKRGISNYFDPIGIPESSGSGSGGILGGKTVSEAGAAKSDSSPPQMMTTTLPAEQGEVMDFVEEEVILDGEAGITHVITADEEDPSGERYHDDSKSKADGQNGGQKDSSKDTKLSKSKAHLEQDNEKYSGKEKQLAEQKARLAKEALKEEKNLHKEILQENQDFQDIKYSLQGAIDHLPDIKDFSDNVIIDITPEGLRIQIVDREDKSMFEKGSSILNDDANKLLQQMARIFRQIPNKISITGHTDATPYSEDSNYTNWELSSDRAHACRKVFMKSGLTAERIASVVGKKDNELLIPESPTAPQNRRIGIVVMRQSLEKSLNQIQQKAAVSAHPQKAQETPQQKHKKKAKKATKKNESEDEE